MLWTPRPDWSEQRDWKRPWRDPPGFFTGQAGCFCCEASPSPSPSPSPGHVPSPEVGCCPCTGVGLPPTLNLAFACATCACLDGLEFTIYKVQGPGVGICSQYTHTLPGCNPAGCDGSLNCSPRIAGCETGATIFFVTLNFVGFCDTVPPIGNVFNFNMTVSYYINSSSCGTCDTANIAGGINMDSAPNSCDPFFATGTANFMQPDLNANCSQFACAGSHNITITVTE